MVFITGQYFFDWSNRSAEKRLFWFSKVIGWMENVKGKKFSIPILGVFELEKKSQTTLPSIVLTHHLVFRVYFVILTILKILQNFALHGENWKMRILKNWPQHQIKWVTYCKWNFKCFKIWTNFKVWDQKMKLDFWKWKNAFFSQTVPPIEKITAPYEYKLLILHYRVPLFFHFDTPLSF